MSNLSHSSSVITSKPSALFLENNDPMLTRAKIGKSKPKVFMVHTEYERLVPNKP